MTEGLGFYIVTFAIISGMLNIFLIWYLKNIIKDLLYVSRNLSEIQYEIERYRDHLEAVGQMDVYYGDETIVSLMSHTKYISKFFEDYEDLYVLVREEDDYTDEDEEDDIEGRREEAPPAP